MTELVNLGVSRAAVSLRQMVGRQIILSVPSVRLVDRRHAVEILRGGDLDKLVAVHQVFEGDITGRVLLIFPETKSLELVRAVTSGDLPLEDIVDLEQEALAETGNIILNGCLATIANQLLRTLKISLPEILMEIARNFFLFRRLLRRERPSFLYTSISRCMNGTSRAISHCSWTCPR